MALGAIIIVIIAFAVILLIYSYREKKILLSEEYLGPKILKDGWRGSFYGCTNYPH